MPTTAVKYTQVRPDLFLSALPLEPQKKATTKRAPVSHLWVIDRSQSMWSELRALIEDIKKKARKLPEGDYFSLGWFSSEGGRFGFPLKGYRINPDDFTQLDTFLDQYASTVGLTCFSEVLEECIRVISELSPFSRVSSFMLLTDGYPVVSNQAAEQKKIQQMLERLSTQVSSAQLIGYGDFYNKVLMADMARWVGGTLQHSSSMHRTSLILGEFVEAQGGTAQRRVEVELPHPMEYVFALAAGKVISYNPFQRQDGTWCVLAEQPQEEEQYLYGVSYKKPAVGAKLLVKESEAPLYGAALVLSQNLKTADAISCLGTVGDVYLIDKLSNAFNNAEFGAAEGVIEKAIFSGSYRYQKGKNKNYLPKDDAFSLFGLVTLLADNPEVRIYPYHKSFSYKRVGPSSTPRPGYPTFHPETTGSQLVGLTWHQEQINLSMLTCTQGYVDLETSAFGLEQHYPSQIWRNYTVVRDGALWTESLPLSIPAEVYRQLEGNVEMELISTEETYKLVKPESNNVWVVLNLKSIPIINARTARAATGTSSLQLAELFLNELTLGGRLKVAKEYLKEAQPVPAGTSELSAEQVSYLKSKGIDERGFSPPSDRAPVEDYYYAPALKIQVKGFSTLPSVNKIKEQVAAGKELKGPAAAMYAEIQSLEILKENTPAEGLTAVYKQEVESLKAAQKELRRQIQETKFSILMGNQWFADAKSRDEVSHNVDGLLVTIKRDQIKVSI